MKFFRELFGDPLKQAKQAKQVGRQQQDARGKADVVYGPVGDLGTAIVSTSYNNYQNVAQVFGFNVRGNPSEQQMLTFYEFLYFYSHVTLRTAAAKGFTQPQFEKLQSYLGPLLASTAVDSFIGHWPDDFRKRLRSNFYEGLNIAEQEYSQCRRFLSPDDPLNKDTVVGKLAGNIADLWERSFDTVNTLVLQCSALHRNCSATFS